LFLVGVTTNVEFYAFPSSETLHVTVLSIANRLNGPKQILFQARERTPPIFHPDSSTHERTVAWVFPCNLGKIIFESQKYYLMFLYYILIITNVSVSYCEQIELADCPHISIFFCRLYTKENIYRPKKKNGLSVVFAPAVASQHIAVARARRRRES